MKNILILAGSPRRGGNTDLLADAFLSGVQTGGACGRKLSLAGKTVHPCTDCRSCFRSGGACVWRDDMQEIYEALAEADIVAFATPVYFYGCSAQMKAVIDRLHNPIRNTFRISGAVLLSACADEGQETFAPLLAMYRAGLRFLHIRDLGAVTVDGVEARGAVSKKPEALEAARSLGFRIAAE